MRYPLLYYVTLIPITALVFLIFYGLLMASLGLQTSDNDWKLCRVQPDATIPGTATVLLLKDWCGNPNGGIVYETEDSGASWQKLSESEASSWTFAEAPNSELRFSGDRLFLGSQHIWTYPRYMFRTFFWPWNDYAQPQVSDIISLAQAFDTTYAALGNNGLLIGPNPPDSNARPWTLVTEPFEELRPGLLTIHNPFHLILVTALGLLVPPLPFIHAWLLAQVWRYAVPGYEMDEALRPAWRVSLQLTFIGTIAVILWLTNMNTRFYAIVGGMAVLVVVVGLVNAYQIAQQASRGWGFTARLLVGTALVSLIVPAGVATSHLGFGWLVILTLMTGFIIYRRLLEKEMMLNASQWEVDLLSLEMVGGLLIGLLLLSGVIPLQLGAVLVVTTYVAGRLTWVLIQSGHDSAKKGNTLGSLSYRQILLNGQWWTLWFFMTIGWVFSAGSISMLIFWVQMAALSYFNHIGQGYL